MIILLFGEDTYRSKRKLREIIKKHRENHPGELRFEDFEASDIDYQDFKDLFRQSSMFTRKKMVVIRHVFEDDDFKKKFLKEAKQWNQSDDTVVLFEEKAAKSDSLFKFIKKKAQWEQFEPLKGKELKKWTSDQFKERGSKIDSGDLSLLVDFVGGDLWRLSNEIEKLSHYREGKEIKSEDVKLMVRADLETDIFKTIDAFALKNKKKALDLIQEHLNQGDSPFYILSMVNYQLRNLLSVKQLQREGKGFPVIKRETDLNPYVLKKTLKQCRSFDLEEIKKIYHQLLEVDLNIKTGKIDEEEGLKELVAKT